MRGHIPLDCFDQDELPVLVADPQGAVRYYNSAAADLFGCDPGDGLGRRCWRLARLRTPRGGPFCSPRCPLVLEARAHRLDPVHDVVFRCRPDDPLDFEMLAFPIPPMTRGRSGILHLLKPARCAIAGRGAGSIRRRPQACPLPSALDPLRRGPIRRLHLLSPREQEVLRSLAAGGDAETVAGALRISALTVRNHIQGILRKLHLHRQVDAILALMDRGQRA